MAGHFDECSAFVLTQARLSDCVIGHVLPRGRVHDYSSSGFEVASSRPPALPSHGAKTSLAKRARDATSDDEKAKLLAKKKAIRREQLRQSQARFRQKQRDLQQQQEQRLGQQLHQLRTSIQEVKLQRQRLLLRGKSKPSPWCIVSEVLRLIETSFESPWCAGSIEDMQSHPVVRRSLRSLQTLFLPSVAMGELRGFNALTEQLRRYVLCFGDQRIEVERIEPVAPGVARARMMLSVSVTESSLKNIFPQPKDGDGIEDGYRSLREQLLGQRLHCSGAINFLLNENNGCVERLEVTIGWWAALCQALGNPSDAACVFGRARVSSEGVIGDMTE